MVASEHEQTVEGLMDGERIERSLRFSSQRSGGAMRREETLLLTNSRIIHVAGEGGRAETFIASVDDVDSVYVGAARQGYGAFAWAALAGALSAALYGVLEHETIKIIVPLLVMAMGAYLVISRLFFPGSPVAVFRVGSAEIEWRFEGEDEERDAREFIRDLYAIKTARARGHRQRWERW